MPRVKRGTKRRAKRKKILDRASGYFLTKSKLYRSAKEAVERGLKFAYSGRKQRKRQYRSLWIVRIGAAAKLNGMSYNQFIHGLKVGGYRTRSQDSGGPGGERSGRICQPGDAGQGRDQRSGVGRCQISAPSFSLRAATDRHGFQPSAFSCQTKVIVIPSARSRAQRGESAEELAFCSWRESSRFLTASRFGMTNR